MKILFVRNLCLVDGYGNEFNFERMRAYDVSKTHALELIEQGFACEIGSMKDLPITPHPNKEEAKQ